MKRLFSIQNSLETIAALLTLGAILGVLQTFVVGKHFVIPTMILAIAVLFGNLARFGMNGQRWAKHTLFWIFFLIACHAFFALFWAATPRQILGDMFLPVYGIIFILLAALCAIYAAKNRLFE